MPGGTQFSQTASSPLDRADDKKFEKHPRGGAKTSLGAASGRSGQVREVATGGSANTTTAGRAPYFMLLAYS